ncbi:MAG: hypothetical protein K2X99_05455 [Gemmatimonadaceae bacterium]|nr:hypothetical protein [Gemmatimonadaceae bacterium]
MPSTLAAALSEQMSTLTADQRALLLAAALLKGLATPQRLSVALGLDSLSVARTISAIPPGVIVSVAADGALVLHDLWADIAVEDADAPLVIAMAVHLASLVEREAGAGDRARLAAAARLYCVARSGVDARRCLAACVGRPSDHAGAGYYATLIRDVLALPGDAASSCQLLHALVLGSFELGDTESTDRALIELREVAERTQPEERAAVSSLLDSAELVGLELAVARAERPATLLPRLATIAEDETQEGTTRLRAGLLGLQVADNNAEADYLQRFAAAVRTVPPVSLRSRVDAAFSDIVLACHRGEFQEAYEAATDRIRILETAGLPNSVCAAYRARALVARRLGAFSEASEDLREHERLAERYASERLRFLGNHARMYLLADMGRFAELIALARECEALSTAVGYGRRQQIVWADAMAALARDDWGVVATVGPSRATDLAGYPSLLSWMWWQAAHGLASALSGDRDAAASTLDILRPFQSRLLSSGDFDFEIWCQARTYAILGQVEAADSLASVALARRNLKFTPVFPLDGGTVRRAL